MSEANRLLAQLGAAVPDILLPARQVDIENWAVIACDQFTSEAAYWDQAATLVGENPSALHITLPEIYLNEANMRIPRVNARMREYLDAGLLETFRGFVLVKRVVTTGVRWGLVALLDLEQYDFSAGSHSAVRATEGTILSRLPPRVAIRKDAPLELPHILVLVDDPEKTLIEPLAQRTQTLAPLYDFDLMLGGGRICGYGISEEKDIEAIARALSALSDPSVQKKKYGLCELEGRLTFAVGDGNHSLATAKAVWEARKKELSARELETCPARYALVELNNLHSESLIFEPIHRLVMNADPKALVAAFKAWAVAQTGETSSQTVKYLFGKETGEVVIDRPPHSLPVGTLQIFLDDYLAKHPESEIDYIHDDDALARLAEKDGSIGFLLTPIGKSALFKSIIQSGALPRKTFSIGSARDKRYYLEARKIR